MWPANLARRRPKAPAWPPAVPARNDARSPSPAKLDNLQMLRALAAFSIVVLHAFHETENLAASAGGSPVGLPEQQSRLRRRYFLRPLRLHHGAHGRQRIRQGRRAAALLPPPLRARRAALLAIDDRDADRRGDCALAAQRARRQPLPCHSLLSVRPRRARRRRGAPGDGARLDAQLRDAVLCDVLDRADDADPLRRRVALGVDGDARAEPRLHRSKPYPGRVLDRPAHPGVFVRRLCRAALPRRLAARRGDRAARVSRRAHRLPPPVDALGRCGAAGVPAQRRARGGDGVRRRPRPERADKPSDGRRSCCSATPPTAFISCIPSCCGRRVRSGRRRSAATCRYGCLFPPPSRLVSSSPSSSTGASRARSRRSLRR